jgi:hypothetical protein
MANRIPLIVDTTDGNKIKELPIGSNLDLTGSGIVGTTSIGTTSITADVSVLNSINTNNIIVNASADLGSVENLTINGGTSGQVLTTDGVGNLAWSTLGNYNQSLNTTDNVTFNTVATRRITAPINVTAEIRTSSTGDGVKIWQFLSTGNLVLPNYSSIIGDVTGNTTGYHTGDVKGSVFGNDSTMLVDGNSNKIVGPIEVDIANFNITGGASNQVLKVGAESLVPEWGFADRLYTGLNRSISYDSFAPNQGWKIASNEFGLGEWLFRDSGDLRLPNGFTDITNFASQSLLRGNWGVVNVAKINLAGSWPFNGIGFWANPVTTRVWDSSTIILDYDTWEALKAQYPAWVAGDAIPNDLICLGSADYLGRFNNFSKIITPTEFEITTSGGYITDVRVAQAGINQSGLSSDNLQAFLPGDTLTQNTAIPAGGIIGRIPPLPINYQDSGLTLNQGQLVVNPINADSTVEPVVAKFYGDVVVTGDILLSNGQIGITYTPADNTDWTAPAPATVQEALDRLAAVVKTLNGSVGA